MDQTDNSLFKIPFHQTEKSAAETIEAAPKNQLKQISQQNSANDQHDTYQEILEIGNQISKMRREALIEMEATQ